MITVNLTPEEADLLTFLQEQWGVDQDKAIRAAIATAATIVAADRMENPDHAI